MKQLHMFKARTSSTAIESRMQPILDDLDGLPLHEKVAMLNRLRLMLHEHSPFKDEPVDFVQWVPSDKVVANDYNPNSVAPPEMELLRVSIAEDGYTQPIVSWPRDLVFEVVDGFHRHRVGKECDDVRGRVYGYLPLAAIKANRQDKGDRIASTIRHNRARGKHRVDAMSDIVLELKNRNWTNERIAKELGMDQDEILRLCQITGLAGLFSDQQFSKSWDIEDADPDFVPLCDDFELEESDKFRTVNTSDGSRIFHTHDKWECAKAGFYATTMPGMTKDECERAYADFLSDELRFSEALLGVISQWKHSCEHYLTNSSMNRIAWLGQAAMCYATGIPSTYRAGFNLLSEGEQVKANEIALEYLNRWLGENGRKPVPMQEATSDNQMDLY